MAEREIWFHIVHELRPAVKGNGASFHHISLTHNFEYNYDRPHPIATIK
ncbi:MAG: hypothetical protein GXP63_07140 [DPANN group archaeon]|nr:hypothetical protein [DPANN group archaeon]